MRWFVLGPGPSMSQSLADSVKGHNVCVVCNAYQLAPWADYLVANDKVWWNEHPSAKDFNGRKFSASRVADVEVVNPCTFNTASNSGVLALDLLRNIGATQIVMLGFDFHGTHFFGPYTNRCRNTPERRRQEHRMQFRDWAYRNKKVDVVNCTEGSQLDVIPTGNLRDYLQWQTFSSS